jgi:spore coat polysaccharide biosynthesis predicted glycosyltransferase SpsG
MSSIKETKARLEEWKKEHPQMAFFISTDDMEFLIRKAELADIFEGAKICKCP